MDRTKLLPGLPTLLALFGLGFAALMPALSAGFLNFDDNLFFGPDNPEFARHDLAAILSPSRTIANVYLPVAHLSLYLDWLIAGSAPWLAHLHSLLLHALCGFVLARLCGRLGLSRLAATMVAALFVVHPALVESAAWVSSRKDLLSGLFTLLCLSQLARGQEAAPVARVVLAVLFALLALYSKATAMVLPLLGAGVLWLAPRDERSRARWVALALVALAAVLATLHHRSIAVEQGTLASGAPAELLTQVPGVFWHYVQTAFWPRSLNVLYPEVQTLELLRSQVLRASVLLGALLVGTLLLAGLSLRTMPSWRLAATGLLSGLLALVPFNSAFPASAIAVADRYLYLAVPFFALALVAVPLARGRVGLALGACCVLPLGWLAHQRAADFATSEALWRSSLARTPENAVACINLAKDRVSTDPAEARELFERAAAVARHPVHRLRAAEALRDLALLQGRNEEALLQGERAVQAADALPQAPASLERRVLARITLATVALRLGQKAKAHAAHDAACELCPGHPGVTALAVSFLLEEAVDPNGRMLAGDPRVAELRALITKAEADAGDAYEVWLLSGRAHAALGEYLKAHQSFERSKSLSPMRPESWLGIANLLISQGLYGAAEQAVRDALAHGVADPALFARLGLALVGQGGQGKLAEAREWYEAYLKLAPGDADVRKLLAAVLTSQAMPMAYRLRQEELEKLGKRIKGLDPQSPKAALLLGLAARGRRDFAAALVLFEQARAGMPDDPEPRRLHAETLRDHALQLWLDPKRRDGALEYFREFVAGAPPEVSTAAAKDILEEQCKQIEERAVKALHAGKDLDAAERGLRRCLALEPERRSRCYLLGLVLVQRDPPHWGEALDLFSKAEGYQRGLGLDAGLPVLYGVIALQKLGKPEDAKQKAREFLAGPGPSAEDLRARVKKQAALD